MSREDLSAMLTELAEQVQPQPQAARAWAKARQVRRRRAVIGATVAVLLVSATITLYRPADRSTAPVHTPSPTPIPDRDGHGKDPPVARDDPAGRATRRRTGPRPLPRPSMPRRQASCPSTTPSCCSNRTAKGRSTRTGTGRAAADPDSIGYGWTCPSSTRGTQAATGRHPST